MEVKRSTQRIYKGEPFLKEVLLEKDSEKDRSPSKFNSHKVKFSGEWEI